MINIRPLSKEDLTYKIKWYNDPRINKYLHYEKPFTYNTTLEWFEKIKNDETRFENVIEYRETNEYIPVGIIGLFSIDYKNKKAGIYITIGDINFQRKGIAYNAMVKFMKYCFQKYGLQKIYLYTDVENVVAQNLYKKVGFTKEGVLRRELFFKGRYIDRLYYGILREEFENKYQMENR